MLLLLLHQSQIPGVYVAFDSSVTYAMAPPNCSEVRRRQSWQSRRAQWWLSPEQRDGEIKQPSPFRSAGWGILGPCESPSISGWHLTQALHLVNKGI